MRSFGTKFGPKATAELKLDLVLFGKDLQRPREDFTAASQSQSFILLTCLLASLATRSFEGKTSGSLQRFSEVFATTCVM